MLSGLPLHHPSHSRRLVSLFYLFSSPRKPHSTLRLHFPRTEPPAFTLVRTNVTHLEFNTARAPASLPPTGLLAFSFLLACLSACRLSTELLRARATGVYPIR